MTLTIKYFGMIADKTGRNEETVILEEDEYDLETFKELCFSKYQLTDMQSVQVAVNQSLGAEKTLKDGDEIAFLPPFSGG